MCDFSANHCNKYHNTTFPTFVLAECTKFYEEWRIDEEANERILSDSDSIDSEDEAIVIKLRKRVRWKPNVPGESQIFLIYNLNQDYR